MPDYDDPNFDPNEPQGEIRQIHLDSSSVEITKENLWKDKVAGRKKFADKLATIIENVGAKAPAVILLEGEWGTGKTYFLKSFRLELEEREYKAIYFDAFAEDFSSDPLLAICGQLWKNLENSDDNVKKILNGLVALGKGALRHYGVDTDVIKDLSEATTSNMFKEYVESRENLETLKGQLSSMVTKSQGGKEGEEKPLVFIIDELDRCRPTFALELLERVKHLFQVPGIIFVFGANKESLMKAVQSEYGNPDPEYLQKFFDLELKLPAHVHPSHIAANYEKFIINYEVLMITGLESNHTHMEKLTDTDIISELYYPLMDIMGITLRQAQRATQILLHCLALPIENALSHKIEALSCLILLKVRYPDLYTDFAKGNATCEKIFDKIIPLFDAWTDPYHVPKINQCRRWFIRVIYHMAEGEEKQRIMKSDFPTNEYVKSWDTDTWQWIQHLSLKRSEVVAMLENLDCS